MEQRVYYLALLFLVFLLWKPSFQTCTMEERQDTDGKDLPAHYGSMSAEACQQRCLDEAACIAVKLRLGLCFYYESEADFLDSPGITLTVKSCPQEASSSTISPTPTTVDAAKSTVPISETCTMEERQDTDGKDLPANYGSMSAEACKQRCLDEAACIAVKLRLGLCFYFENEADFLFSAGNTLTVKSCPQVIGSSVFPNTTSISPGSDSNQKTLAVSVATSVIVVAIISVVIWSLCYMWRQKNRDKNSSNNITYLDESPLSSHSHGYGAPYHHLRRPHAPKPPLHNFPNPVYWHRYQHPEERRHRSLQDLSQGYSMPYSQQAQHKLPSTNDGYSSNQMLYHSARDLSSGFSEVPRQKPA